jgi:hypothetical protein
MTCGWESSEVTCTHVVITIHSGVKAFNRRSIRSLVQGDIRIARVNMHAYVSSFPRIRARVLGVGLCVDTSFLYLQIVLFPRELQLQECVEGESR